MHGPESFITVPNRDGNSVAYAAARCCWCTAPRSVATKICITSQHQRSAAYNNFFTFFLQLLLVIFFFTFTKSTMQIIIQLIQQCILLKQEKVNLVQVYFFRIRSIPESAILATKNLPYRSFDRLNMFFDTNKKILVLVG